LKAQEEILTGIATSRGWSFEVYNEGIVSGVTISARPVIQQLLEDARTRKFSVCLIIEFERLSRSQDLLDWLEIKKTFRDAGIKIQTPQQSYDLSQAEDDFVSDLLGILSKREKLKIKERCRRGIEKAKREGAYLGGLPPMGYIANRNTKRLEVYEPEAKIIRMIFKLAETMSPYQVCRNLNANGIKTPKGHLWRERRIRQILNLITYAGKRKLDTGDIVDLKLTPLVTMEQYKKVQMGKKERLTRVHDTNAKYLLTGILRCPYCGRSVCSWVDKRTFKSGKLYERHYYTCSRKRDATCSESKLTPMDKAERILVNAVKSVIAYPEKLTMAYRNSGAYDEAKTIKDEICQVKDRLDEAQKRKENLIDAVANNTLSHEDVRDKMKSLNDQLSYSEGKLIKLEKRLREIDGKGIENVIEVIDRFRELFDNSDVLRKRELLKALLEKAALYREKIILHFRFPVNADGSNIVVAPFIERQRAPKPALESTISNILASTLAPNYKN